MVGVIVITDEDHVNECGRWSVSLSVKIDNIYEDCVIKCGDHLNDKMLHWRLI